MTEAETETPRIERLERLVESILLWATPETRASILESVKGGQEVGGGWSPLQEWEDSREPPSPPLASVTVSLDKPTET